MTNSFSKTEGWEAASGVVLQGHEVASGRAANGPYPLGTILMQKPFFKERGLDLSGFFEATLNVSITPMRFLVTKPRLTFREVRWTDLHPPEDFSFADAGVRFNQRDYPCLVYYPHPETKKAHFQDPSVIELLAPFIYGIYYGSQLQLYLPKDQVKLLALGEEARPV
jgi:hypothetical protein